MKSYKILISAFALSLSLISIPSFAEDKIALVSLQRALNEVEEGKKAMATIQGEANAKKRELETLKTNLKKMRDDLEKQKMVLTQDAMQAKAGEIQSKFMELQQKAMQYDQELKKRENESVSRILQRLRDTVIVVAKEKSYDLVFENSAETVIYSTKGVDITPDVIRAFNSGKK